MTVHDNILRDKRPPFLCVFATEYKHFATIPKRVRPDAMAVYMCLASHSNANRDVVWPSYATICEHTGLSRNTAIKAIDALTASGHITVEKRFLRGDRISNRYTLQSVTTAVDTSKGVVHEMNNPPIDVVQEVNEGRVEDEQGLFTLEGDVVQEMNKNHTNEPDEGTIRNEPEVDTTRAARAPQAASHPPSSIGLDDAKRDEIKTAPEIERVKTVMMTYEEMRAIHKGQPRPTHKRRMR